MLQVCVPVGNEGRLNVVIVWKSCCHLVVCVLVVRDRHIILTSSHNYSMLLGEETFNTDKQKAVLVHMLLFSMSTLSKND